MLLILEINKILLKEELFDAKNIFNIKKLRGIIIIFFLDKKESYCLITRISRCILFMLSRLNIITNIVQNKKY